MNHWEKKGLLFNIEEHKLDWSVSHAQLPVADVLSDRIVRVYFAGRNSNSYSSIGYVDFDFKDNFKVIDVSSSPILSPGPIGHFDEHGVFPSAIVDYKGKKYLFYIGWNQGVRKPLFYASVGMAISEDNGKTFKKYKQSPILSRSEYDPCLVTSPNVFIENDTWHMTYVSGERWEEINGSLRSFYNIKYAFSENGIEWKREGVTCINFRDHKETNIARSAVIKSSGVYKMWFCYVYDNQKYRMGYAESTNMKDWVRNDYLAGIDIGSNQAFDSEMICYPNLFQVDDKLYMLYNGNNYGEKGFGLAELKVNR